VLVAQVGPLRFWRGAYTLARGFSVVTNRFDSRVPSLAITGFKMTLLFAFLIGLFVGLRSLTPLAVVAWAVYLGWLKLARPLSLIGSLPAVIILSLLALTELILDKLPNTPNRTAPLGLIARIVTSVFTGACVSLGGGESAFVGAGLGLIGIVGLFRRLSSPRSARSFLLMLGCRRSVGQSIS
jgi:uncharacterized membrane protein